MVYLKIGHSKHILFSSGLKTCNHSNTAYPINYIITIIIIIITVLKVHLLILFVNKILLPK